MIIHNLMLEEIHLRLINLFIDISLISKARNSVLFQLYYKDCLISSSSPTPELFCKVSQKCLPSRLVCKFNVCLPSRLGCKFYVCADIDVNCEP